MDQNIGIVVIGKDEGQRLVACLEALPKDLTTVYVDSASTDESVANAEAIGASVVHLDMSRPFSAARARNGGVERLAEIAPNVEYVMFLDGDTVVDARWMSAARAAMDANPRLAVVAGRLRERYPDRSWYNTLCDYEWAAPAGPSMAVGGNAFYRLAAFNEVGGFADQVIAGEEPELCFRLRKSDWQIERLPVDMALHDADIHHFGPWWRRAVRSGYAFTLGALMHGQEGYRVRETIRFLIWGGALPVLAIVALFFGLGLVSVFVAALYGAKFLRLRQRLSANSELPGKYAGFLMLSNVAEVFGFLRCMKETLTGKREALHYKDGPQTAKP